jgi:NAD(P)-dependent dehydrogenase (short-subunit alcohol dehydrogenase family)
MKTILITGATSGIGLVAACELASQGHKVMATARNAERGQELLNYYNHHYPIKQGTVEIIICDLLSFASIVTACQYVKKKNTHLDIIINNAGVWNFSYKESTDKIEEIFQVNVLAPILINHLLLDLLLKSSDAKSIFTASALHQGNVDFDNLEFKNGFSGFKAYRQSKLEIIMLCRLLANTLKKTSIGFYCQHPGFVSTKLGRDANWLSKLFFRTMGISPAKGAQTLLYLADTNKNELISGEYYAKKKVKKITKQSNDLKVAQHLLDQVAVYLKPFIGSPSIIFEMKNQRPKTNHITNAIAPTLASGELSKKTNEKTRK